KGDQGVIPDLIAVDATPEQHRPSSRVHRQGDMAAGAGCGGESTVRLKTATVVAGDRVIHRRTCIGATSRLGSEPVAPIQPGEIHAAAGTYPQRHERMAGNRLIVVDRNRRAEMLTAVLGSAEPDLPGKPLGEH